METHNTTAGWAANRGEKWCAGLAEMEAMLARVDPAAAFTSIAQWLAPGGRFAFAVWGPVNENPWMEVARDLVAQFVELLARNLGASASSRTRRAGFVRSEQIRLPTSHRRRPERE